MDLIWAKRLVAGTQSWNKVPEERKVNVCVILRNWVAERKIPEEKYEEITGYILKARCNISHLIFKKIYDIIYIEKEKKTNNPENNKNLTKEKIML